MSAYLETLFPGLRTTPFRVTSFADGNYNCVHVEQAKIVCRETADWRGFLPKSAFLAIAICEVAIVVRLVCGNGFAKMEGRFCSSTGSIFPLGLGWETVQLLVLFPQFLDELLAIIPGNLFHRQVFLAFEMAGVVAHDLLPLFLGHGMNSDVKAFGQSDFVLGFIFTSFLFFRWTAHSECAWRNPDKLHTDAVREILGWVFLF